MGYDRKDEISPLFKSLDLRECFKQTIMVPALGRARVASYSSIVRSSFP